MFNPLKAMAFTSYTVAHYTHSNIQHKLVQQLYHALSFASFSKL